MQTHLSLLLETGVTGIVIAKLQQGLPSVNFFKLQSLSYILSSSHFHIS